MPKPETRLRKKIMEALREEHPQGWFAKIHGNPYQDAGIPDIIGCVEGLFVAIEVKDEGGEATKIQISTMAKISRAKGTVGIAETVQEALDIVKLALIRHRAN